MPNAPSLSLGGRLSHKPPPVASHAVGYPQCPLSMAGIQQGGLCVNLPPDLREEERVTIDNNAFLGGLGGLPQKKQRALPFALKYLFFCAV